MGVGPQVEDEPVFVPGPDEHGDVDALPVGGGVVDGDDGDGVGLVLVTEGGASVVELAELVVFNSYLTTIHGLV